MSQNYVHSNEDFSPTFSEIQKSGAEPSCQPQTQRTQTSLGYELLIKATH